MKNRTSDIFHKGLRSLRSNLGWKIVSLAFAVLLWNYVIGEVNPTRDAEYTNLRARVVGLDQLNTEKLTLQGDPLFKNINVTVALRRSELKTFHKSDIDVYVDVSAANKEGEVELKIKADPAKGTVVRISPDRVTVTVEELKQRTVPVECETTGSLPQGYWGDTPELNNTDLTITGAASVVDRVEKAVVTVPLDDLNESISVPKDYTLQDTDGNIVDKAGLVFSAPNCIVSLTIYPMKTVRINVESAITGTVANGYEIGTPEVYPTSAVVAGPAETLAGLEEITIKPIDVTDAQIDVTAYKSLELPKGVYAVNVTGATVNIPVSEKMTSRTFADLPVTITGVGSGLLLEAKVTATAIVTYPELIASKIRSSRFKLFADASGLSAGTYNVKVWVEVASEAGVTADDVTLQPEELSITLVPSE